MTARAFICGCTGQSLTTDERAFFEEMRPWGLILFARNIGERHQIIDLVEDFRKTTGRHDAPVLIDQEGGRVQRLRPPLSERHPPAASYATLYARHRQQGLEAARIGARLMAQELREVGITVDCLPVLDIPVKDAHHIIGDRAYGETPEPVIELARAVAEGLLDGSVLPVIKHIPGHGRARSDSHEALPIVEASREELELTDFMPFKALNHLPLAMTAHVVYTAIDPLQPATLSPIVINDVIRGYMGYDGLLMSDDLSMKALSGSFETRTRCALDAGCDVVLHCNGDMREMRAIAAVVPTLTGDALRRANAALAQLKEPQSFDVEQARAIVRERLTEAVA
jgi:beta-N-acetylhexosaminidase